MSYKCARIHELEPCGVIVVEVPGFDCSDTRHTQGRFEEVQVTRYTLVLNKDFFFPGCHFDSLQ